MIPAGPAVMEPRLEEAAYVAADGARLPLRTWGEPDSARAVVLALHGFGDYSGGFEAPATQWATKQIATYAYDQRGFGGTPTRGRWAGTESMIADAATMLTLLRARHPDKPLHLVGESMGGAVALALLGDPRAPRPDSVALVGPAVRSRATIGRIGTNALEFVVHVAPWFPNGPSSIDFGASDNVPMLRRLSEDKMILRAMRVDMVYGLVGLMDAAAEAVPRLPVPYLWQWGENDRIVPPEPTEAALRRAPRSPGSKLAIYRNGYHMLLRDLKADSTTTADIAQWIVDRTAPLPSGADATASPLREAWGAGEKR